MEGPDHTDEEKKGIIPRIFDRVFEKIEAADINLEFCIKVAYF
jgi:hypothetical protein